jgi:hypothetical protein
MYHRSHLASPERQARSRLAQLLHEQPFLCGSLVTMRRRCGNPGCRCTRGELHPGLYLALRVGAKRKMIYIPHALEEKVGHWVATYQEVWGLIEKVSEASLKRLLQEKEQVRGKRS